MGEKIFVTEKGKMEVLQYKDFYPSKRSFNSYLGVRLIAYFEGNDSYGQNGDRITFIQLVKDTFYGVKRGETEKHYTWRLNKDAVFTEDISGEEEKELDWTIDQIRKACGNTDFRYTEKRMEESLPMSSEEGKTEKLMEMSEDELLKQGFGMLRNKSLEQKREYIQSHMFSQEEPLPNIVFSAEKKEGRWERARMADMPCTACDERMVHEGGQEFQVAVLHESSDGSKQIIGTLFWGWRYKKEADGRDLAELLELEFKPGCTREFANAVEEWNRKAGYMKIEGLRIQ